MWRGEPCGRVRHAAMADEGTVMQTVEPDGTWVLRGGLFHVHLVFADPLSSKQARRDNLRHAGRWARR